VTVLRFRNLDVNIQRESFEDIHEEICGVFARHNMVWIDSEYPPGYVNRDETELVPRYPASREDGARDIPESQRATSELWVRVHESQAQECSCCGNRERRENIVELPDVCEQFCSEACLDNWCENRGGFRIRTSGGRTMTFIPGANTAGNLAPYNSEWYPGHHAMQTPDHRATIGFEVEKEDSNWHARDTSETDIMAHANESNWLAVSDGSLSYEDGFELVSPGYSLTNPEGEFGTDAMQRDFDNLSALDAETSARCGGHITLSVAGYSGEQIARRIEPFYSLLFAIYPKRLLGEYARPMRGEDSVTHIRSGKFRAINVMADRVEFRIFSAVQSAGQLMNRVELIRALYDLILSDDDGRLLSIGECRDSIEAAISKPDSRLMKCVKVLTEAERCGSYAPETCVSRAVREHRKTQTEKRMRRRKGFKLWLETGDTSSTEASVVKRYLSERMS